MNKLRADNCTAVTALLDPPGPPLSGLIATQKAEEPVPSDATFPTSDGELEDSEESDPEESLSELASLLSTPAANPAETKASQLLDLDGSLPLLEDSILQGTAISADELVRDPVFRVLRNRAHSAASIDNNCTRKASVLGVVKRVVSAETNLSQLRKRPMTRSFPDAVDDRNASDTENQVNWRPVSAPTSYCKIAHCTHAM